MSGPIPIDRVTVQWTPAFVGLLEGSIPAETGECPACQAFLHPLMTICVGCGYERGSAFSALALKVGLLRDQPIETLLTVPYLSESIAREGLSRADQSDSIRHTMYRAERLPVKTTWSIPGQRIRYFGGLEWAPHPVNAQFYMADGWIVIWNDVAQEQIAAFRPERLLAAAAHPALDPVLGGRTIGLFVGAAAVFDSFEPTEGGGVTLLYADEGGIWRTAVLGNRAGLLDPRYKFEAYRAWVSQLGWLQGQASVDWEWEEGIESVARSLGFKINPETPSPDDSVDTKICPDCAESVKAAAKICRYCRHEF